MKRFLLILSLYVVVLPSFGQKSLTNSRQSSYFTYIYRLDNATAKKILFDREKVVINDLLSHPVDSFLTDHPPVLHLEAGNYLQVSAQKNELNYKVIRRQSAFLKILENRSDLQFIITDKHGNEVKPDHVYLNNRKISYNEQRQLFRTHGVKKEKILEIQYNGLSNFYKVGPMFGSPRPKKTLPRRILNAIKTPFTKGHPNIPYYYTPPTNPGFFVFNKPIYRPGDTVKFKAFIVNKKSKKPVSDTKLIVRLKEGQWDNGKIIATVTAYRPGAFEYQFKLSDSLDLTLDDDYVVSLETLSSAKYDLDEYDGDLEDREYLSKRKVYQSGTFHYEEYDLKTNNFTIRSDKAVHSPGSPISLYFKATDENDLAVQDGRVELVIKADRISEYGENIMFIPDTLWNHKMPLEGVGETKLVLPDSIFPKADIGFSAEASFMNSNNELIQKRLYLSFTSAGREISGDLHNDTLKVDYKVKGKSVATPAVLAIVNADGDTVDVRNILLPARQIIDPKNAVYSVNAGGIGKDFMISGFPSKLSASIFRQADSLFIKVDNPRKLSFWYTVFTGKSILKQGKTSDLNAAMYFSKKKNAALLVNYLWGGKPFQEEVNAPYQDKLLDIQTNQPSAIYPGQKVKMEVSVKDAAGKPVDGADITAFSFTRKFHNGRAPFVPYLGKSYPSRKLNRPTLTKTLNDDGNLKLNWKRWGREMGLDSIEYYRFTHPESIYRMEEPAPDSATQIAPFIVEHGDIIPVHVLYLDNRPVYFSQTTHLQRYSFITESGYHKLGFRIRNARIDVDSIFIRRGTKLIIALNKQMTDNAKVQTKDQPEVLSAYEAGLLNKYLVSIVPSFDDRFATVSQGNNMFLLGPGTGAGMYNYRIAPVLTGPLNGFSAQFKLMGEKPVFFEPEPGYSFEFKPGLIKQKSLPSGFPFQQRLTDNVSGGTDYTQYALTANEAEALWQDYLDLRSHTTALFPIEYSYGKANGKLQIKVDTLKNGRMPFVKNIIVYQYNDPDFMRIYPGNRTDLNRFKAGKYRIFYLLKGNSYLLRENVEIRENGTSFYGTKGLTLRPADSISKKIADLIETKRGLYENEGKESSAAQLIKETFNEKYLDTSVFTEEMSGTVRDKKDRSPLPGVSVKVKGSRWGTTTDISGHFSVKVPPKGKLVIAFVGYIPKEIGIEPDSHVDVLLDESVNALQEVVVVGYGTRQKSALTGAVTNVTLQTLNGMLPGIQVRGATSAVSGRPVVILDGMPYEGNVESLDPSLIGEINILKSDAATALYGARGANGVILITTKKNASESTAAGNTVEGQQQTLRKNFSDYAFWSPRLTTNEQGKASFDVTFPDDITNWRTFFIGMSGKRQSGYTEGQIKSYKSVSAGFTAPLFAVRGDEFKPIGKILNYTTDTIPLTRSFRLNDQTVKEDQLRVYNSRIDTFTVQALQKDSLRFEYAIKRPGGYVDGERRSIPVIEKGALETKGIFEALEKDTTITLHFDKKLGKVSLYAEASLMPVLLDEMQRLRKYEYLCNEQLASKLKGLLAERKIRQYLHEPFKYDRDINDLIKKLEENRRKEGTWGWWKDTAEELWISLHAAEALMAAEAAGFKIRTDKQKLIDYLTYHISTPHQSDKLTAIELLQKLSANTDVKANLSRYEKELPQRAVISEYEKMKLMMLKQRAGLPFALDSLLRKQRLTMFGNAYWGEPDYSFFDNSIQLSILAYRILREEGRHPELLSKIRNYFLEQRKDGQWRNTYESSLILETILPDILHEGREPQPASLKIEGLQETISAFPYNTILNSTDDITIQKKGGFPVYITAYQQFFNPQPMKVSNDFTVNTWFEKDGRKLTALKGGESVVLKVDVTARANADYVMIEVPIPAGCSYETKDQSFSYRGDEEHREYFKTKVSIFCKKLKEGRHTYNVRLTPRYSGTYTLNPAKAEMMYFPVFHGREGLKEVTIK